MMSDPARRCYRKYERNAALAAALEEQLPDDDGWSIVIRFYAALHLMNAYLLTKQNVVLKLSGAAHEHRKSAMAKCPELRDAPQKFRLLKEMSEHIRYKPEFEVSPQNRETAKALLAKIVAIVGPKLRMN